MLPPHLSVEAKKQVRRLLGRDVTMRLDLRSYWADWTIVMQCWLVYRNLQLLHSSGHKMPPLGWLPSPYHSSTSTTTLAANTTPYHLQTMSV